jgi:dGTPase
MLQPSASRPEASRGRLHRETPAPTRNEFQRDRDRIVHSTAFRRLVYKTQVFLNHEGDLFRTRLTHSLEVAQIGRSIARSLGLHEDLVEAISLAHDLGHTPFGHAGQDALNECLLQVDPGSEGFEHNLQSLRVVDELEERYPAFNGLNLSFETREGILKHCSRRNAERLVRAEPGGVAQRFLDHTQPSLEAQLCNAADEIAYNAHDLDDGVRSGLLAMEQLREIELLARLEREALDQYPGLGGRRLLFEIIRRMLSEQIYDVIETTNGALAQSVPPDADAARRLPGLVKFSADMRAEALHLKRFLSHNLYRHPKVLETTGQAKEVIRDLFYAYLAAPAEMSGVVPDIDTAGQRQVADYIAGMTDRFALREHHRLTGRILFAQSVPAG